MTTFTTRDRRVKPTTARPFAAGLLPYEPASRIPFERHADRSALPAIDGAGLTMPEWFRMNGARNRATASYAIDCPEASAAEINRVGRAAATDELRRLLRDRPVATATATEPEPTPEPVAASPEPEPARPSAKAPATFEPSIEDRIWWCQHSPFAQCGFPAPIRGGAPEPEPECGISGLWVMPGEDLEPTARDLSDDASGAFLGHDA